jgi:hypothetical protein
MNVWKLVADQIRRKGNNPDRAVLFLEPGGDITGKYHHGDRETDMIPTKANTLMLTFLGEKVRMKRIDKYTADLNLQNNTGTLTAYGLSATGEKVQHIERITL